MGKPNHHDDMDHQFSWKWQLHGDYGDSSLSFQTPFDLVGPKHNLAAAAPSTTVVWLQGGIVGIDSCSDLMF